MQLHKITATGAQEKHTVNEQIFGAPVNMTLIAQALRVYMSNARQGTSKVKSRGEVNITKKKIYKQKGTGGARHGAKSAPIFVGGGVTHGPKGNQNWSLSLPKILKQKALVAALSWQKDSIVVVDSLEKVAGKTKDMVQALQKAGHTTTTTLVVLEKQNPAAERALRNIPGVWFVAARELTALAVCQANKIMISGAAIAVLEARLLVNSVPTVKVAAKSVTPKVAKVAAPKVAVKPAAKKIAKAVQKPEKK